MTRPPLSLFAGRGLNFEPVSSWDPYVVDEIRAHYTGSRGAPPGKKMVWLIREDGREVGIVGIGEPAFKLSPRRRLGIQDARPLDGTVSCFIFRIAGAAAKSSSVLKLWHVEASDAWRRRYGWRPVHWETMIGPEKEGGRKHHGGALGACFRRAGYRSLGWTTGRGARRPAGNTHGPRVWVDGSPKLVLYRGPLPRVAPSSA